MVVMVVFSVKLNSKQQALKEKYGRINLVESDLQYKGAVLYKVLLLGFTGGWVAGALGLGGGVIFNPMLLSLGVPPKVSSATGMYLITFSKISTCFVYFIYGMLMLDYGIWVACWATVGSIFGLWVTNLYMNKVGRQSILILFLAIILAISSVGVPFFGYLELKTKHEYGEDIFAFK